MKSRHCPQGFTLIELIITITIAVILTTGAFLNVYNYKIRQGVSSTGQEIVATLRVAQNYSLSQENENRWGVYFENTEENGAFFVLFPGMAYSATTTYTKNILPSTIQFVSPASESTSSIVFAPITGLPDSSSTVKISLISNSNVSSTIIVNTNGQIQYDY